MNFLALTLPSPEENLALDEALLLDADEGRGGEVLRLWELPGYAVVLGFSSVLSEEVKEPACWNDGVPILRRCSGGGTVLLGPGCLAFSLVLSLERTILQDITHSYTYILERMSQVLVAATANVVRAGSSDLALGDLKISGNAQRRKRAYLLHHGTVLYGFAAERIGRYLAAPPRQPEYRRGRAHADFVNNVPLSAAAVTQSLRRVWGADAFVDSWPEELVQRLVREKYATEEWTRRR